MRTSPIVTQKSRLSGFIDFLKHTEHMARISTERTKIELPDNEQVYLPPRHRLIRGLRGHSTNDRDHSQELDAKNMDFQLKEPLPEKISRRYKLYQDSVKRRYLRRIERAEALRQHDRSVLPQLEQSSGRFSQIRSVEMQDLPLIDRRTPLAHP